MPHKRQHDINDTLDHAPGTNNTVLGTDGGVLAEVPFSAGVSNNNLVQRDGSGDIAVNLIPGGASAAASKQYVDNVAVGLKWVSPAQVLKIKDDGDAGGAPPAANRGDAFVVNNWGGGYNDGDIVEYDGTSFNVILSNVGGEPPDGTRAVVIDAAAAGSFAGHEDEIATYDTGTSLWSFTSPVDGNAILIVGENGINENRAYTYDAAPGEWIQFSSLGAFEQMQFYFGVDGTIAVGDDQTLWLIAGQAVTAIEAYAAIKTAPTGAALTIEIEKSSNLGGAWSTVVSSAALQIAAGAQEGEATGLSVSIAKNDILRINIDQVGSTVAGADLSVVLKVIK